MPDEPDGGVNRPAMIGFSGQMKLPGIDAATGSVSGLNAALHELTATLSKYNSNTSLTNGINRMLTDITTKADAAARSIGGVRTAIGGMNTSGPSAPATAAAATTVSGGVQAAGGIQSGWVATALGQASGNLAKRLPGGQAASSWLGSNVSGNFATDLLMAPLRFLQDRISTNRETALSGAGALSMVSRQQGAGMGGVLSKLAQSPGGIYGNPQELLNLFGALPGLGASYNFGNNGQPGAGQGVRAAGLLGGIRQAQALAPGQSISEIAGNIGGFAANSGAQRQAAYLTGGAYSMIASGGRQKSLSEWAESILKWLRGMRGGSNRGKDFTYGELMAQYFPGSNIDAWFEANGVPQGMRDYWWTYALGKANQAGDQKGTTGGGAMEITPDEKNLAYRRLRSSGQLTKTEFGLAGAMSGAYANREVSNQWFNQNIGKLQQAIIPALVNSPLGRLISELPDTLENLLMGGLDRGASAFFTQFFGGGGDVAGDIGDYGEFGGTSTSGLHPDMKTKVGAMMRANPRLSVTSGLRDTGLQQKLKGKGHSRVSGKPSAHTRGLAADLGPPSQYNWIVKNAGKFGLKSGARQGEPWHVGIGDFNESDPLGSLSGMLGGSSVMDMIMQFMNFFTSKLGGILPGVDMTKPGQGPEALGADFLSRFPSGTLSGLPSNYLAMATGHAATTPLGPPSPYTGVGTSDQLGRAIVAAKAAAAAGFHGDALFKMVSIAGRESQWNPSARNAMTSDRGMWQINMAAHKASMQQHGFSENDLFNPANNALMAWEMSGGGTNFSPWKGSDHSSYSGDGGRFLGKPGWDPNGDPLWNTQQYQTTARTAISQAGLGDMDAMMMSAMLPSTTSRQGTVQFNNSFVISGNGNGSGGIDIRRTVSMIADHLEDEMKRRMARTN